MIKKSIFFYLINTIINQITFNINFRPFKHIIQSYPTLDNITYLYPTIHFSLGIPKQYFEVSIDTSSSQSWFIGEELKNYFNNTFNYNSSLTNIKIQYMNSVLLEGFFLLGNFMIDLPSPVNDNN